MDIKKIAIKIAKEIMASENIGDVVYRIMSESPSQISVTSRLEETSNKDILMGWFDTCRKRHLELLNIAKKHKYKIMEGTMDMETSSNDNNTFSLCFEGEKDCDTDGFIEEIKKTQQAKKYNKQKK